MEYFLSHIIYIVIAAVFIGIIGFLAVWAADKSAQMDREKGELKGLDEIEKVSCGMNCGACGSSDGCSGEKRGQI